MITSTIPHPTLSTPGGSFGVIAKKLGRGDSMKRAAELESQERPHRVYEPDGKTPSVDAMGRPLYAWRRPSPSSTWLFESITSFVTGFINAPDGLTVSPESLWSLFDEKYDVTQPSGDAISFPLYLLLEWSKPETFADPTQAPSASS